MKNKSISVVIPTKNEEKNIYRLLISLNNQVNFIDKIIIADANSTDNTIKVVNSFPYNTKLINGGLPAKGRNDGAKYVKSDYILFIDADIVLSENIIENSIKKISETDADLITCKFRCNSNFSSKIIYLLSNIFISLSKLDKPFAIGGYFLIKKSVFDDLGGFDETLMHCEDYFLSKKVKRKKFHIIKDKVYTDDRRVEKMGRLGIIKYFIKNIIKRNNINYFKKDVGYWK
jgi:GT2 family glycosyltransferase